MASYVIKLDADETALNRKVENVDRKLNRLDQKASNIGQASPSMANFGSDMAGAGGGSMRGGLSNPWERRTRAQENLGFAKQWGFKDEQLSVLELEAARANTAASRADKVINGSTFQSRAMDALMTSRIGAGGMMPLVNRLVGLAGPMALDGAA